MKASHKSSCGQSDPRIAEEIHMAAGNVSDRGSVLVSLRTQSVPPSSERDESQISSKPRHEIKARPYARNLSKLMSSFHALQALPSFPSNLREGNRGKSSVLR